jgi:hypothetical protein
LNRYIKIFTASYLILIVLLAGVAEILKLESSTPFAVASVLGATLFASMAFAKDHARAPTSEEKTAFAWRALLAVWLVSLLCAAVFIAVLVPAGEVRNFLSSFATGSALALAAGFFLFISAIHYVAIRWSFGWYARRAAGG